MNNVHSLLMKGWALVKLGKYAEAAQCYYKSRYNVLDTFLGLVNSNIEKSIEERKRFAPYLKILLQNDDFFVTIAKQIKANDIEPYMNIYIRAMEIISLLYVNFVNEKFVATYTSEIAVENMLKALWLSLITNSNDPQEGQSLLDYFYSGKNKPTEEQRKRIEQNFGMFATSFTFNYDHLNQFRLYGKSSKGVETGGVSIVVNENFFRTINPQVEVSSIVEKSKTEKGLTIDSLNKSYKDIYNFGSRPSLSLFRCIYIDPKSGFVASLGQREEYTFYQSKEDVSKIPSYKNYMESILNEVREQLQELKNEIRDLDPEIVSQLLLPLRYLTKDVSFREEQECRIFKVKSLVGDDEVFEMLRNKRTNYLGMKEYVKKVILGAECDNKFENEYRKLGIENVKRSKWKFEDKSKK